MMARNEYDFHLYTGVLNEWYYLMISAR